MSELALRSKRVQYQWLLGVHFIITGVVILICLILWSVSMPFDMEVNFLAWLGNLIFVWGLYIFWKIKRTHLNQYSIFFVSYYIFSYGQLLLFSCGMEYEKFDLIRIFPSDDVILYCIFFCVGTCFLLLGAMVATNKELDEDLTGDSGIDKENFALNKAVKIVAWTMFIVSAPIQFHQLVTTMAKSIAYGYDSIYAATDLSSSTKLTSSLSMLFIPSVYMLVAVYKRNRIVKFGAAVIILSSVIGVFIIGARSSAMAMILSYLFLRHVQVRRLNKRDKLLLSIGLLCLLALLPIIPIYRATEHKSLAGFITMVQASYNLNGIFGIVGELGSSMQPWLLVHRLIPGSFSFGFGKSYVASFLTIVPSILMGGFSFTKYAELDVWLQSAANMDYGPGFSTLAEAYYNFGWIGLPFLSMVGWMYFKFLGNSMIKGAVRKYKDTFSAIALAAFITTARGAVYLSIRQEVYMIFLPVLAITLVYRTLKAREEMYRIRVLNRY